MMSGLYRACAAAALALAPLVAHAADGSADGPAPPPSAIPDALVRVNGLEGPMGVAYDPAADCFLVANAPSGGFARQRRGFIAMVSADGQVRKRKWVAGLDAPKGMRVHEGRLYVADLDRVRVIDLARARIERTITVAGAFNLTDLALDTNGDIYSVDAGRDLSSGAIFRIPAGGEAMLVARSDRLLRPNSIEIANGALLVGTAIGGNALLRLRNDGQLIDVRNYPPERFAPSEVRSADGIAGVVRISETVLAVSNIETGSVALMDVALRPLPDPVGKIEQEAKRSGVEFTAIITELQKRYYTTALRNGGLHLRIQPADASVFVTHRLQSPRKLAYDPKRRMLAIAEFEHNSLALVPIGPGFQAELQQPPIGIAGMALQVAAGKDAAPAPIAPGAAAVPGGS